MKGEVVCCPEKGGGKRWGIYDTLVKCEDLEKKYKELEKNLSLWGIVEISIRNSSVLEYMKHWEGRTLKAESEYESLEKKYRELEVLAEKLAERIRCHNLPFHNGCANPNDYSTILEYESWKKGAGK